MEDAELEELREKMTNDYDVAVALTDKSRHWILKQIEYALDVRKTFK